MVATQILLHRPTPRWSILRAHQGQHNYYLSTARFNVTPAGRRSGKTEIAKRRIVKRAIARAIMSNPPFWNGRFFAAAPTRDQAKRIYWQDLKALVPLKYLAGRPKESELIVPLINRVEIHVIGLDKPERFEGSPWDGGVLDEYGNMKPEAWMENVLPALADRQGWCDLIGVPEGRNHYYDRWKEALADNSGTMLPHHWTSAEILPASEIEMARRMLDELTFQQEYEASFVNFSGQAYYAFNEREHCCTLSYNSTQPLIFCFDFNVSPGVAVVAQEQIIPGAFEYLPHPKYGSGHQAWARALKEPNGLMRSPVIGTGIIGEVYIARNSNTPAVCRKLIDDWGEHQGIICCYGDSTGGSRGTAKVDGSDWEIISDYLYSHFGDRVEFNVPKSNPPERVRINAVNTRLKTSDGTIRLAVDPQKAPNVVKDFEGVRLLEGGSGEIDKRRNKMLTHITDAIGYYIAEEFPIIEEEVGDMQLRGIY